MVRRRRRNRKDPHKEGEKHKGGDVEREKKIQNQDHRKKRAISVGRMWLLVARNRSKTYKMRTKAREKKNGGEKHVQERSPWKAGKFREGRWGAD